MRWLQLSDLHVGKDNISQRTALNALLAAVDHFTHESSYDVVFLTGDLAFSGKADEYIRIEETLIAPLKRLKGLSRAQILAVPGNHDADCEVGLPIVWGNLGSARQQEFFSASDAGVRLRSTRAAAFKEYEEFTKRTGILSCQPTTQVVQTFVVTPASGAAVDVICMNTSLFSDKDVTDERLAQAPVDALREAFAHCTGARTPVVLGHHPLSWFNRESAHHLRTLLIERNAIYLHGHQHEVETIFGMKGLVSVGFGAVYQAPLTSSAKPYYRNSFAMCEVQDLLELNFISWDFDYGAWVPETRLPPDILAGSANGLAPFRLALPTTRVSAARGLQGRSPIVGNASLKVRVTLPIWIDAEYTQGWKSLLEQIGILKAVTKVSPIGLRDNQDGSVRFVAEDREGKHLVTAFSPSSSVITYSIIEQTNTLLDTESLDSCLLVTFGQLAEEAKSLSARLKDKKALVVVTGVDIASAATRFAIIRAIRDQRLFDLDTVSFTPLMMAEGLSMLARDAIANKWFCVFEPAGSLVEESSTLTHRVREIAPELVSIPYWTAQATPGLTPTSEPDFDRSAYLSQSALIFDTVRYAGLAALGLHLPVDSLRKIYVPAAADVATDPASQQALKAAVDDFIEALKLDGGQREQLEMQLRSYYGVGRSTEAGAATALYQKYGAVLVVGDPGSGKSCFVRNEILCYCQPPPHWGDWYRTHTPVFLPLAEAARIAAADESLLEVCVRYVASQRLSLNRRQLDILLGRGEVAFFFDGVDEVGSIDVRQRLLGQISDLVSVHQRSGNRFVVTSRPAAVHAAEVPEELTKIRLRGLTNDEISLLATRIMSIELNGGSGESDLRKDQRDVVNQLIRDCEDKPGIRRLARNPLLLTLLVLIYANSGPLAARRHTIYSQAVKTLVSVRHRAKKPRMLSEADLRRRLGALAIAIYRGRVSEIPARSEVWDALKDSSRASPKEVPTEIDQFMQEVAEATGLIVIHPRSDTTADDLFSFMHHSFLEYYAAVGFIHEGTYSEQAPLVALSPRWQEVVTLMFGLLGERGDISTFLRAIAEDRDPSDRVTASRLFMAVDCALECDVPPDEAQALIGELLTKTLSTGAASVVPDVRSTLASKVQELLQNTGSEAIKRSLIEGTQSFETRTAAAHIDFIARMPLLLRDDEEWRNCVSYAFQRDDATLRIACMSALQTAPSLRNDANLVQIRKCLDRGSVPEQLAALQFLDSEPALIGEFSQNVVDCLNSKNRLVANLAARCALIGGLFNREGYQHRGLLDRALSIYTRSDGPQKALDHHVEVSQERLEELLLSDRNDLKILGIRCLVVVQREAAIVHRYLFSTLRESDTHEVQSACLEALALDARIAKVASLADAELVCKCVRDNHMDVRNNALRALKHFTSVGFVRDTLVERYRTFKTQGHELERSEVIKCLAAHGVHDKGIRAFLQDELLEALGEEEGGWGARRKNLVLRLLHACEQMGGVLSVSGSSLLGDLPSDFRVPVEVRRFAIRAFGRIGALSAESCMRVVGFFDRPERVERLAAYKAAGAVIERCKGSLTTMSQAWPALNLLKGSLISKWDTEFSNAGDRIDISALRDIRSALVAFEEMRASYEEYSLRTRRSDSETQGTLELG